MVILALFEIASRTSGAAAERKACGFAQVVLGADGCFSTSKAVVALWTALLATSLIAVTAAASESASGAGTVVTTPPSPNDLVTNDSGEIDLVDTQYVIFTLVAVVYFVGAFAFRLHDVAMWQSDRNTHTMPIDLLPSIPDALLGLTSLAALTYVGHKAVATQGLRLVRWTPDPARKGEPLVITLVNLPSTASTSNTTVVFRDAQGNDDERAPDPVAGQRITIDAPRSAGTYSVTISSPNFSTGPHTP